ncbi:MAG: hypothetical protein C5B58_11065 [Acidobacteria bacterium]|nr:MAG: hypothetical protein C5B58_11065 [Acidobacteriota bacterium]
MFILFALLLAWKLGFFRHFVDDEMVRIGISLATGHGYSNPYLIPTGPAAQEMPLYPLFLSVIYRVFRIRTEAETFKIILACLVSALRCALLFAFCLAQTSRAERRSLLEF